VGSSSGNAFVKDLPLIIAFIVLAAYTWLSGLRAPALIAFIKDTLIYVMIIVAIVYIPASWAAGATSSPPQAIISPRPTPRPASRSAR
jgi:Na+/proline symporter